LAPGRGQQTHAEAHACRTDDIYLCRINKMRPRKQRVGMHKDVAAVTCLARCLVSVCCRGRGAPFQAGPMRTLAIHRSTGRGTPLLPHRPNCGPPGLLARSSLVSSVVAAEGGPYKGSAGLLIMAPPKPAAREPARPRYWEAKSLRSNSTTRSPSTFFL
jgi:hypothetical protein